MSSKKDRRWLQALSVVVAIALLVIVVVVIGQMYQLLGFVLYTECMILGALGVLLLAHIRLRQANSLARMYAERVPPKGATNVKVHLRARFFKMAVLGWFAGGRAEFNAVIGPGYTELLKSRLNHYVYLNPGAFRSPACGRLTYVSDTYEPRFGHTLGIMRPIEPFGDTMTANFSGQAQVIVTFDTNLPMKQWAHA